MIDIKHSNFKIGDAVIRRWNNRLYYICHDADNDKWEFLKMQQVNMWITFWKV